MALLYSETPIKFESLEECKKYKPNQKFTFICTVCGQEAQKYRCNIKLPLVCGSCNKKKTFANKDWSERNKKSEATKIERYGDAHYTNTAKIRETWNLKTENEITAIYNRTKQTNEEKYGGHPAKRAEQKERMRLTCLAKYGYNSALETPSIVDKIAKTNLEKYGSENPFGSKEIQDKIKQTNLDKYSVDNPRKCSNIVKKIKQTCLEKYGVEHPWSNHDVRVKCQQSYTFDGLNFDSSWELYEYIFLKENNINFIYQPNIFFEYDNGKKYFPDFQIEGELIEIKGEQFFKDDKMINPYDETLNDLYEQKHQCMIKNNIKILRKEDLKEVFKYVDDKYTSDYVKLFKNNLAFPYPNDDFSDTTDDGIIRHFHKSIWAANRRGKLSPLAAWEDKSIIERVANNRLNYVGKCKPNDIVYGFNTTGIAPKVSVFSVNAAINLIQKYLSEYNEIFDPFSGFSGRMIGAYRCSKKYIGHDISESHVKESNEIIKYLDIIDKCSVTVKDILTEPNIQTKYECLFTCPPYSDKEQWNETETNLSCDEWIRICLEKYDCNAYLFVVDETTNYKNNIVEEIINKSHFGENKEYVIKITK